MNPDRVLESFLEMVAIESPSWHEAPMAAYCAEKLAEMGFTAVSYTHLDVYKRQDSARRVQMARKH